MLFRIQLAARALSGIGAGGLIAVGMIILGDVSDPIQR